MLCVMDDSVTPPTYLFGVYCIAWCLSAWDFSYNNPIISGYAAMLKDVKVSLFIYVPFHLKQA